MIKNQTFGIIYEDPKSISIENFRFDISSSEVDGHELSTGIYLRFEIAL